VVATDAFGRSFCRCPPAAIRAADGVAAVSAAAASVEAVGLADLEAAADSEVVAVAPAGEIQARGTADLPPASRAVRIR